jgi:hypothetical protein
MLVIKICTLLLDNLFAGYRYSTTFHSLGWNSQPPSGMIFIYARDNDIVIYYIYIHTYTCICRYMHTLHVYIWYNMIHKSYYVYQYININVYMYLILFHLSRKTLCYHLLVSFMSWDMSSYMYMYLRYRYIYTYVHTYLHTGIYI